MSSTLAQERYGRAPGQGRRALIAAGVAGLLVALAWICWAAVLNHPRVTWQDISFDVRSDAQTVVTFDLAYTAGGTATCTVQAQNALHTEVGLQDVKVTAGPKGRARVQVTLPTSERATTGLVKSCVPG